MKQIIYPLLLVFLSACTNNPGNTKAEKIDYLLQESFKDNEFIGNVLVADQGHIIYKKSFGNADQTENLANTDTTQFLIASISKSITAILILKLVDKGIIKLEDSLNIYFKVPNPRIGAISIHQLLTHTSGINEIIGKKRNQNISSLLKNASLKFEPGSAFDYSNSGYVLLKVIAEMATQKKYSQLVKGEVFDVANMTLSGIASNASFTFLAKGYKDATQSQSIAIDFPLENVDGAGSVYSTSEDLYKLDRALDTNKLLSDKMKEKMLKQHVSEKYTYGWFVKERSGIWDVYWQKGNLPGFTSYISRSVQRDQLIVLLSNAENLDLADLENDIAKILKTKK